MYKTVRHGENSLQYTILPQTEEILTNSGLRGKGRDYSPSVHVRRARRRSTARCVALVAVGSLAALALALVPLYAMHGALIVRRGLDSPATPAPFLPTGRDIGKTRKKDLKITPDLLIFGSDARSSETPPRPMIGAATPPWVGIPALKPWRATEVATLPAPTFHERGAAPLFDSTSELASLGGLDVLRSHDKDSIITPTVTPEPTTSQRPRPAVAQTRASAPASTIGPATPSTNFYLITMKPTVRGRTTTSQTEESEHQKMNDLKETLLEAENDEEVKESLEDDEVFSLPPLEPAGGGSVGGPAGSPVDAGDDVTVSRAGGWYGARWPFVDTSSYFQWTGYSPGDNLLLPLLVAALSSLALVLLLALALRRRHRAHCTKAQVGKLTAELQEDNTNLLTAENAEDE